MCERKAELVWIIELHTNALRQTSLDGGIWGPKWRGLGIGHEWCGIPGAGEYRQL